MTTPLPSVPNFLAGFGAQQSDMQSLWVNAAAFFQQRAIFRASQTTTTTSLPAAGTFTTIGYDTILEDPYSGWSGSPNFNWTPPTGYSGWYQVTATVMLNNGGGAAGVGLKIQFFAAGAGSGILTMIPMPTAVGGTTATWWVYLVGGQDAVAVQAGLQNSAGAISTNNSASGQQSTMEITWISS